MRSFRKLSFQEKLSLLLTILGVLFLFLPSLISSKPPPQEETDSFSSEKVKIDPALLIEKEKKDPPIQIIIPSVEIDIPVKEAKIIKGYWQTFSDSAGFGEGSAYPGEIGNQVIFAHARKGLFLNLKNIKEKDKIYVLTKERWHVYETREIKEVLPDQIEVIAPTPDETLTLYTCTGFADQKRLIVIAKPSS